MIPKAVSLTAKIDRFIVLPETRKTIIITLVQNENKHLKKTDL